jgi:alkylation response protein AidB-like acyl-CoA dehydrogenase
VQDTIEGLQEIRELAAQFAADRLRPNVERWDEARTLDGDVLAQLAELGFHGMLVPEAQGGLGFGATACVAVLEEIAWGEPAAAFHLLSSAAVATALTSSRDATHHQWLAGLAAGARCGAIELAREYQLQGQRQPDGWVLGGLARWVLRGHGQEILLLGAAMPDAGRALFVLSPASDSVPFGPRETTIGLRAARLEPAELEQFPVPESARIDQDRWHEVERIEWLGTGAIALGIARAALEHARAYADVREQFRRKLRAFAGIQAKLADMDTRVAAARALLAQAALDNTTVAAARAKLFASETAMWVTTQAVQIFGGYGYMRDYPVEKTMRDAKTTEIVTGANETLRARIAEGLYED